MGRFMIQCFPEKCLACRRCEMACIAAHNGLTLKEAMKRRKEFAARVHVIKDGTNKDAISCRQCKDAPCVQVCPMGALRIENGAVVSHLEYCSGCQLCIMACPYGAIAFQPAPVPVTAKDFIDQSDRKGVALRCDLCAEWREKEGKTITACMEACPAKARQMIELTD